MLSFIIFGVGCKRLLTYLRTERKIVFFVFLVLRNFKRKNYYGLIIKNGTLISADKANSLKPSQCAFTDDPVVTHGALYFTHYRLEHSRW